MRKVLLWTALAALLAVTSPAEFRAAEAVGISRWVAWALPLAVDGYVVLAVMAALDVLPALLVLWSSVTVGMLHRVSTNVEDAQWDAYALAGVIATVLTAVLWRIHCVDVHLSEQQEAAKVAALAEKRALVEQDLADAERRAAIEMSRLQQPMPAPNLPVAPGPAVRRPVAAKKTKATAPPRDQARLIVIENPGVSDAELSRRHNGSDRFWASVKKEVAADMTEVGA